MIALEVVWGSVADWVVAVAAILSLAAVLFAWLSWDRAGKANRLAQDANDIGNRANKLASDSQAAASEANRIAERSVTEAKRSADAAVAAEERAKTAEVRSLERHEVNIEATWLTSVGFEDFEDLIDATLVITNSGPDDALNVRVTGYAAGVRHDWTQDLGDMPARGGGMGVIPISDDSTIAGLGAVDPDMDAITRMTKETSFLWAKFPVRLRFEWNTVAGNERYDDYTLEPPMPFLDELYGVARPGLHKQNGPTTYLPE